MIHIQVLGPGCAKCKVLFERAEQAADALGIEYQIEKVTDVEAILRHGVMTTPALVVDGRVKVAGHVPTAEKLKEYLS